ncbi:mycothiol transferase [Streptomyces zagrosensis]|uniref:Putative damage-inducible protein DinB n=1 Tax=Streptomyces zagrosensis TaxID=1042984 RepID=A0A7W9UW91_9ACTN|nr:DUF664 domain-containing protein [Streptomyces zagrosensis]MBB5933645.1 putative damage-inducible protein DinB [Streptomyces zagrosensis]
MTTAPTTPTTAPASSPAPTPTSATGSASATVAAGPGPAPDGERAELLRVLGEQRATLLIALRGLTDDQAAQRSTVSELTLGGIVKHLAQGERVWTQLMSERRGNTPDGMWDMGQYQMNAGESLSALRDAYAAATAATDAAVANLPTLDVPVPLPPVPWDPQATPETWSARLVLLQLLRETAQHAGHADIIRESLDGANTTAQLGDAA